MRTIRLFVYGSLKHGFANASELEGAAFEGAVATAPGFALYDLGDYPALVRTGSASVSGEVYSGVFAHNCRPWTRSRVARTYTFAKKSSSRTERER